MIKSGCLVCTGWNYRGLPYLDEKSALGIVVGESIQGLATVETLKKLENEWDMVTQERITKIIAVMWPNGTMTYHAICNLVEVKKDE